MEKEIKEKFNEFLKEMYLTRYDNSEWDLYEFYKKGWEDSLKINK